MIRAIFAGVLSLLGIILALIAGIFGFVVFFAGGRRFRWFNAWRTVAVRYRGIVESRWWLPQMRLVWREQPVKVTSTRRLDRWRQRGTTLVTSTPETPGRLVVMSTGCPAREPADAGLVRYETGNAAFDRQFVLLVESAQLEPVREASGSDANLRSRRAGIRSKLGSDPLPGSFSDRLSVSGNPLLAEAVRWQLMELAQWSGTSLIRLDLVGQRLRIQRAGYLTDSAPVEDFLRLALRVVDQLRTGRAEGLQFVNEQQATLLDDVSCPICADQLEGRMVICVRCKTPHCRECWDYNGRCAMFGCGEIRCVVNS